MKKIIINLSVAMAATTSISHAFDVFHPIKSTAKIMVAAGGVYLTSKALLNYLIQNPSKIESYFSTHPEAYYPLERYVSSRISNTKDENERIKYIQFAETMGLSGDPVERQYALENDKEWIELYNKINTRTATIDVSLAENGKLSNECSIEIASQLLTPAKEFNVGINKLLPAITDNPLYSTKPYDVDTYSSLVDNYSAKNSSENGYKLEQDHIPSYLALEKFFTSRGVAINPSSKKRNKFLNQNATAIAIPDDLHVQGRTWGKRNSTLSDEDKDNLLVATIKDITTTAYRIKFDSRFSNISNTLPNYINGAMVIYARNKMLCLYDVK